MNELAAIEQKRREVSAELNQGMADLEALRARHAEAKREENRLSCEVSNATEQVRKLRDRYLALIDVPEPRKGVPVA